MSLFTVKASGRYEDVPKQGVKPVLLGSLVAEFTVNADSTWDAPTAAEGKLRALSDAWAEENRQLRWTNISITVLVW